MNAGQLRHLIIRPALQKIHAWSAAAEELLMGTAAQESQLGRYVKQHPAGPALGIYQMEPTTHALCWSWAERNRPDKADAIRELLAPADLLPGLHLAGQLVWNNAYATALARVLYLSIPRALPDADDLLGQARYWKAHWNTPKGKGTVEEYVANYRRHVKP